MRVVFSSISVALAVAMIGTSWAGQDKDKQKEQKAQDVGKGLNLKGTLDPENGKPYDAPDALKGGKKKTDHAVYLVNFVKGKTYQIDMIRDEDAGMNPYLFLEDSKKKVLAQGVTGTGEPGTNDARITFNAPADGAYRIVATSLGGTGAGDFSVKVAETKAPPEKKAPEQPKDKQDKQKPKVLDVGKGIEIKSKLDKDADGPYEAAEVAAEGAAKNKKQHKLFLVNFEKGKTYVIDMIKAEDAKMDPYLFLEDAKKKILAEDDDSGGDLDSQIEFKAAETGVYRIICTTYGPVGSGEFTFKVTPKK